MCCVCGEVTEFLEFSEETEGQSANGNASCNPVHDGDPDCRPPEGYNVPKGTGPSTPEATLGGEDNHLEAAVQAPRHSVAAVGQRGQTRTCTRWCVTWRCVPCLLLMMAWCVLWVGLALWLAR